MRAPKTPVSDGSRLRSQRLAEGQVAAARRPRARRLREKLGRLPLRGVGDQRELADDESAAAGVEHAPIELPALVLEDPQARDAVREPLGIVVEARRPRRLRAGRRRPGRSRRPAPLDADRAPPGPAGRAPARPTRRRTRSRRRESGCTASPRSRSESGRSRGSPGTPAPTGSRGWRSCSRRTSASGTGSPGRARWWWPAPSSGSGGVPRACCPVAPEETGMTATTSPSRTSSRIWRVLSTSMCASGPAIAGAARPALGRACPRSRVPTKPVRGSP